MLDTKTTINSGSIDSQGSNLVLAHGKHLIILLLGQGQEYQLQVEVRLKFDPKIVYFLPGLFSKVFAVTSDEFVQLYLLDAGQCKML